MKLVLIGDGESPHLLKWARALAPRVELWAASSRGFSPEFEALLPAARRLALNTAPDHGGGNIALLKKLPQLGAWLAAVDAEWLHAHYLTSHGTLAWAAKRGWRLRAQIAGSAWGSDILVTPERGWAWRWLTQRVLEACAVLTSDSRHMSERMQALGAKSVMTFPFGLEALPKQGAKKQPWLFFANRGLEPIYRPERVLRAFAAVAAAQPEARLIVANDGSLRAALEQQAKGPGPGGSCRVCRPARCQDAGGLVCQGALVLQPAAERLGVGLGAGGDGARMPADSFRVAGQPRAAPAGRRPDPGRRAGGRAAGSAASPGRAGRGSGCGEPRLGGRAWPVRAGGLNCS